MKKNYSPSALMRGLLALVVAAGSALTCGAVTRDLGYVTVSDNPVYEYDGYCTAQDEPLSVGIKFPAQMLSNFAGAKIKGFRMGWSCSTQKGDIDLFIREGSFNGENKASKHATVSYKAGWNTIMLDEPYEIKADSPDLFIGYHVDMKAKVICIPFSVLGNKPENSAFMCFETDRDAQGNMIWTDVHQDFDALLLVAILEMSDQNNRAEITSLLSPGILTQGDTGTGLYTIQNHGTNNINSIELEFTCGDAVTKQTISLSQTIKATATAKTYLPVPGLATGETTVKITKVNGKQNEYASEIKYPMVAVPEGVAEEHTRRPFLEFFCSENAYQTPSYFDNYFGPAMEPFAGRLSYLCHHDNDQFMMRDNEAIQMLLDLADGDKWAVSVPCMTLDRDIIPSNAAANVKSVAFPVLVPPYSDYIYGEAFKIPTFASISVNNSYDAAKAELTIGVNGSVEPGILPAGEKLKLSVYLVENNIASTSQEWSTPEEEAAYGGVYVNQSVIRQQPTPIWGVELEGDGTFSRSFKVEIDPEEWKQEDMRTIAVIHRSENNPKFSRQVINCAEADFVQSSIDEITTDGSSDAEVAVNAGTITFGGSPEGVRVYNTDGTQVPNSGLAAGLYVAVKGNISTKVLVK